MPYDANGKWIEENASVAAGVTGLIAQDSPLMKQARTGAMKTANSRGLLNSSIAAGAGEDAAIKAATPIATADASNTNALNQTSMNNRSQEGISERQQQTQRDINAAGITSSEKISGNQLQTQRELNAADLASRSTLQAEQLAASDRQQQASLGSQATLQAAQIDSQGRLQTENLAMQQTVAGMQIAASDRQRAADAVSQVEVTYANNLATITNNKDIPATIRAQYLENIQAVRQSSYGLIEQIYGVKLSWAAPAATPTYAAVAPKKGEPNYTANYAGRTGA